MTFQWFSSLAAVGLLASVLSGCGQDDCGGNFCGRITNQHQENGMPTYVKFAPSERVDGFGALDLQPIHDLELAPGENTGWFDISGGTVQRCGAREANFRWRLGPSDGWSESVSIYKFPKSELPDCMNKGDRFDLVLR